MRRSTGLLALPLALALNGPVAAETISLRADYWCPYNCEPGSDKPGILIEIAKRAFERAGHQVDYQILNWARAKQDVSRGARFGLVGMGWDPSINDLYHYPEPLIETAPICFYGKTDWHYEDLQSLNKVLLGIPNGYDIDPEFDAYVKQSKSTRRVIEIGGPSPLVQLIQMANARHIDVLLEDRSVLRYTEHSEVMSEPLPERGCMPLDNTDPRMMGIFIVFGRNHPDGERLVGILNDGLQVLKASGEYEQILNRYYRDVKN